MVSYKQYVIIIGMNLQDKLKDHFLPSGDVVKEKIKEEATSVVINYVREQGNEIDNPVTIIIPKEELHGDYAFNVMYTAGVLKKNPADVAQEISKKLREQMSDFDIESTVSGYINFKFKKDFYFNELGKILIEKDNYGKLQKNDREVMVEFGQPNTHKAFTVGHIKGTISGLSVSKLIENLGYKVIQTNYYGDIGMHTAKCTWGVMQKGLPEDFETWNEHKKMEFIADAYVYASENFDKNEDEIRKINLDIYSGVKTEATDLYEKIKIWSLEHQKSVFENLGVFYDKQYPESGVVENAKKIVGKNKDGIFTKSQGAIIYDGEKEGLNIWVVETSEGNPTYMAKDLALGFQKLQDYPDLYLNITLTAIEQKDHFKAVIKILETLDEKFKDKYFHLAFGWLLMDGKKTSSRSGKNIKGTDLLEESLEVARTKIVELKDYDEGKKEEIARVVALAGIKFLILSHDFNKDVNYDPKKFIDFEGYSGPYILYAYVRAKAILRKSGGLAVKPTSSVDMNEWELNLLKWLSRYPSIAYRAGIETAPHLLCVYLFELAQRFNSFYAHCPVLDASEKEKETRLALAEGTAQVLKNGLGLLGIETIEEM